MEKWSGKPVSFADSTITGGFWKTEQDLCRKVTVNAVYDRFEETGRFEALKMQWKKGMPNQPHIFWESDVTKWIEGAAYFLKKERDPELEAKIDELVGRMERTQDTNGYLNAYFTVVEPKARFTRRTDHELYCAGHLIEGAIAYKEATGKDNMLRVAMKYADLIDRVFRVAHSSAIDTPGHEEIELALMKLYHYTGEERYFKLAEYFINTRGTSDRDETYSFTDQEHMQSHLPVREQVTAEGHSVRALYLYSGMADLALETKEEKLTEICRTLFENITEKRMYITGGVGSTCRGESFTFDYDFPEYTAYNETCASIALALFCRRLWLIEADGRYADTAERALYNTVLSGISLSGDSFFYENPLAVDPRRNAFNDSRPEGLKEHLPILERVKVFGCSCCPPNLVRTIGSIGDYLYSTAGNTIFAQCYMDADTTLDLNGKTITLQERTEYPYDGKISWTLKSEGNFTFGVRIPGWCDKAELLVNGEKVPAAAEKGFVYLEKDWKDGDRIELELEMKVKLWEGNPEIVDTCGRVAVTRGSLVYCAEGVDNDDTPLRDVRIDWDAAFELEKAEVAGREMPVLKVQASRREASKALYSDRKGKKVSFQLKLLPYYAWANRGVTEMDVWFLEK